MDAVKFETVFSEEKKRQKWREFLIKKYGSLDEIPNPSKKEDFKEFVEELENEIKCVILDNMFPEMTEDQKEKIKKEVVVQIGKNSIVAI